MKEKRRSGKRMRAVSAGGVVWRRGDGGVEVVLVQTPAGRWGLPKGKRDAGERLRDTARREVREETGLKVRVGGKIGVMRYNFKGGSGPRVDKEVHFWLMQPKGGSFDEHDDEHIDVRWFGMAEAMRIASYRNTVGVLERAAEMLERTGGAGEPRPEALAGAGAPPT